MLKGWRDHALYGIIVFFSAGFATAWFLQEKIIIQNQVSILEKQILDLKTEKEKQESECWQKISVMHGANDKVSKANISDLSTGNQAQKIESIPTNGASNTQEEQVAPIMNKALTSDSHTQTIGSLSLTTDKCTHENRYITCGVTVTNRGTEDIKIDFDNLQYRGAQLILDDGSGYKLARFSIGAENAQGGVKAIFIAGVPVLATFNFEVINGSTPKAVKLLELRSGLPSRFMDIQID